MIHYYYEVCNMATLQEWDTSYASKGVELEDVTDDWYDEEGNLIP